MKLRLATLALFCLPLLAAKNDLTTYFIDVEGGQSTLFIAPSGESLLVDTGWPGDRDANRIATVAKNAGLKQIDYLLVTHFHTDHIGGVPALSALIPIKNFVDHGESVEHGADADKLYGDYAKVREKGKHLVLKPGDKVPIKGLDWTIVSANGDLLKTPLPGAGKPNQYCADFKERKADPSENARSVGSVIQFGSFRAVDLGDLTWNKEHELVCPNNNVGEVDLYIVTHHGMNMSGSASIVNALHPRVAVMNNGAKKGGTPEAWTVIHNSPGIEDIWQLHFANAGGDVNNTNEKMIANPSDDGDTGQVLKMVAHRDGSFEITNPRNGYSKKYPAKK